jgi:hypothetical protein
VPAAVRDRLHQVYLQAAVRHMRSTHAYAALLAALTDAGIDHLVFKGPVLTEVVYGNPALRAYTDLDVLVHRADLEGTEAVLAGLGYAQRYEELRPGARTAFGSEDAWGKTVGALDVHIDLHWKPVGKIYGEMAWVWDHTEPWAMAGAATRVFTPAVRLLYLAAHLALHHGQMASDDALYLYYDLALMVRAADPGLDWEEVLALAEAHRLAAPLQAVLRKAEAVWPLELPEEVWAALAGIRTSQADAQAVKVFTTEAEARMDQYGGFWLSLGRYASWRERLGRLGTHMFPSWGYMARRYKTRGPVQTALCYPYRWGYAAVSLVRMVGKMKVKS